jgi:hypothetical protein
MAEHAVHSRDESLGDDRVTKVPRHVDEKRLALEGSTEVFQESSKIVGCSVLVRVMWNVVVYGQGCPHRGKLRCDRETNATPTADTRDDGCASNQRQ